MSLVFFFNFPPFFLFSLFGGFLCCCGLVLVYCLFGFGLGFSQIEKRLLNFMDFNLQILCK